MPSFFSSDAKPLNLDEKYLSFRQFCIKAGPRGLDAKVKILKHFFIRLKGFASSGVQ